MAPTYVAPRPASRPIESPRPQPKPREVLRLPSPDDLGIRVERPVAMPSPQELGIDPK